MADDKTDRKQLLEVLVFRRPDPKVADALSAAQQRGSDAIALCVLPSGKDSATIRVFWDGQIQAGLPQVPLVIAHESETPIGDLLPQLAALWQVQDPKRAIRFVLLSDAAQNWGSLRLSLLLRKLRRRIDVAVHDREEADPKTVVSKHNAR